MESKMSALNCLIIEKKANIQQCIIFFNEVIGLVKSKYANDAVK